MYESDNFFLMKKRNIKVCSYIFLWYNSGINDHVNYLIAETSGHSSASLHLLESAKTGKMDVNCIDSCMYEI
jgi:hypothetical protein